MNSYPEPNYVDPTNRYNYVLSQLEPQNRLDMKARVDYNISSNTKAYVRVAREKEEVEGARGVWWGASEVALPTPNLGTNVGRSVSGNVVTVLSPTMTNEALVSWSRLTLDNTYKDPSKMRKADLGVEFETSFPGASPYIPGVVSWGGGVNNLWSSANDMYAHNDELTFSNKLTKIAGAHGLKFGGSASRLQKQQNFNNNEEGYMVFAGPGWSPGSSGNAVGDILAGRPTQVVFGTAAPAAEYRMWNFDVFAQDSWKLRPNLTLEYGVRAGYWTNNAELNGLGAYFDPSRPTTRTPGAVPGSGHVPAAERLLLCVKRVRTRRRARQPQPVCHASREHGVGHQRERQQRAPRRVRAVLQPEHGQRRVRPCHQAAAGVLSHQRGRVRRRQLRRRRGPQLRHGQRGNAGDAARNERRVHDDAELVHVPEDAQLQRVVRPAHLLQSGD